MSIKLALECPTPLLEYVQPFADFDFILAHKVLEDKEYAAYYKASERIKVLDNSVNEIGEPCTIEDIEKAEEDVGGSNTIISPDFIGDHKKTLQVFSKSLEKWKDKAMPVLQGSNYEEALLCLSVYLNFYKKNYFTIAVPYDICSKKTDSPILMGERRALLISQVTKFENIFIHLLGFDSLEEFIFYKDNPRIVSIDTGAPVLLGLQNKDILDPLESKAKPTLNEMENLQITEKALGVIYRNIALLRKELQ